MAPLHLLCASGIKHHQGSIRRAPVYSRQASTGTLEAGWVLLLDTLPKPCYLLNLAERSEPCGLFLWLPRYEKYDLNATDRHMILMQMEGVGMGVLLPVNVVSLISRLHELVHRDIVTLLQVLYYNKAIFENNRCPSILYSVRLHHIGKVMRHIFV